MRLLLDAHVSGRRVGRALRRLGHDIRALSEEPSLEALADEEVLELAVGEERVLLTHDVGDFPAILREWAEQGRSHAGVILVYGLAPHEARLVVRGTQRWLSALPGRNDWVDRVVALDRTFARGA